MTATSTVLQEVAAERLRQQAKGYTTQHDDDHGWEHAAREAFARLPESIMIPELKEPRATLVECAALLVAAVESIDRAAAAAAPPPPKHAITQVPPWPPTPEAEFMLTRWACECGWQTATVRDSRDNQPMLQATREAAAEHVRDNS